MERTKKTPRTSAGRREELRPETEENPAERRPGVNLPLALLALSILSYLPWSPAWKQAATRPHRATEAALDEGTASMLRYGFNLERHGVWSWNPPPPSGTGPEHAPRTGNRREEEERMYGSVIEPLAGAFLLARGLSVEAAAGTLYALRWLFFAAGFLLLLAHPLGRAAGTRTQVVGRASTVLCVLPFILLDTPGRSSLEWMLLFAASCLIVHAHRSIPEEGREHRAERGIAAAMWTGMLGVAAARPEGTLAVALSGISPASLVCTAAGAAIHFGIPLLYGDALLPTRNTGAWSTSAVLITVSLLAAAASLFFEARKRKGIGAAPSLPAAAALLAWIGGRISFPAVSVPVGALLVLPSILRVRPGRSASLLLPAAAAWSAGLACHLKAPADPYHTCPPYVAAEYASLTNLAEKFGRAAERCASFRPLVLCELPAIFGTYSDGRCIDVDGRPFRGSPLPPDVLLRRHAPDVVLTASVPIDEQRRTAAGGRSGGGLCGRWSGLLSAMAAEGTYLEYGSTGTHAEGPRHLRVFVRHDSPWRKMVERLLTGRRARTVRGGGRTAGATGVPFLPFELPAAHWMAEKISPPWFRLRTHLPPGTVADMFTGILGMEPSLAYGDGRLTYIFPLRTGKHGGRRRPQGFIRVGPAAPGAAASGTRVEIRLP